MPTNNSQFDLVRKLAMALPNVVESTVHGAPSWKLNGTLLACQAVHKSAEPNSLLIKISPSDREQLLSAMLGTYYVTAHYAKAQVVLVRLDQISSKALRTLLKSAWLFMSAE